MWQTKRFAGGLDVPQTLCVCVCVCGEGGGVE